MLAGFVRLIDALREQTTRAAAAGGRFARDRAIGPHRALPRREGRAGPRGESRGARHRRRQLRARGAAGDRCADALGPRRARRAVAGRRRRRGRDRSADGVPRACGARGRGHAGRGRPAGAAADDGAFGQGTRIPHGVRHRARGRAVPAREQPVGGRRAGGRAPAHVRRDHARAPAALPDARASRMLHGQMRYNIPSRFVERNCRRSSCMAVAVPAPRHRRRRRRVGARQRCAAGHAAGIAMAHRAEREARQVRHSA